ncbi:MAG: MFS transporter, partial [Chloroflexota bacterium]
MLGNRYFLYLWLVSTATAMAVELFTITILVTIFEQTESTVQAAGTTVARMLPAFLLGPVAGVLVDRFPRKHVLITIDIFRLGLIGLAIWMLQGTNSVPVVGTYFILAGLAAGGVFHKPARLALIPSLVSKTQLVKANSFMVVSDQIALALSYTIGGWLVLFIPIAQIGITLMLLFVVAILSACLIVVPKRANEQDQVVTETFWKATLSGWHYLRHHPIARPLTIMETIEHIPHGIWTAALMLAFTIQVLNSDTTGWGYQSTSYFTGMIVGSLGALTISTWLSRYPGRIIVVNACLSGFLTLAYANSPTVWVAIIWAFIFGPPFAIRDVAQDALLQGTVEDEQLGRVYATREMLRNVVFVIAGIFFAWLSGFVDIRMIYVIGGLIYILTGIYALSNRALRESKMG